MSKILNVKCVDTHDYNILIEQNFEKLANEISKLGFVGRRICIVTDSNVGDLYSEEIQICLSTISSTINIFELPAGECSKNLNIVRDLYTRLIEEKFDRNDLIVALGGGVVGDLAGFTAATYLRGIDFIQIPTSLLAQVDSSIGGKTGVDFDAYKNMVGAFYQPRLVYINLHTLSTLKNREFLSGMGEIIKHGLIHDKSYYNWLKENVNDIKKLDMNVLEHMIYISDTIKQGVIERDTKEQGERALLNLGHTIGHAIEKLMNFTMLHGECVSLGIVAATYISYKRNTISKDNLEDIIDVLRAFELPVKLEDLNTLEVVETTKLDKKMDLGSIKFVLLNTIGNAIIDNTVTTDEMIESVNYIKELR